jgi:hypothetical protein
MFTLSNPVIGCRCGELARSQTNDLSSDVRLILVVTVFFNVSLSDENVYMLETLLSNNQPHNEKDISYGDGDVVGRLDFSLSSISSMIV